MKIIILSDGFPPTGLGGAEVIAFNLADSLSKGGHDVSVITTTRDKKDVGQAILGDITVYKIYSNYHDRWRAYRCLYNMKTVRELDKILSRLNPDVVHAHNVHAHLSYASLKVARKYSRAVFLTMHDAMSVHYGKLGAVVESGKLVSDSINPFRQLMQYRFRYNPLRNILIKHYLKSVDKIFAVNTALREVLAKGGIRDIEVLHNGIDVSDWDINNETLNRFKEKYDLNNKKVLFFGGRLSSAKGGLIAIDVLSRVSLKIEDIVMLVVGIKNKSVDEMIKR